MTWLLEKLISIFRFRHKNFFYHISTGTCAEYPNACKRHAYVPCIDFIYSILRFKMHGHEVEHTQIKFSIHWFSIDDDLMVIRCVRARGLPNHMKWSLVRACAATNENNRTANQLKKSEYDFESVRKMKCWSEVVSSISNFCAQHSSVHDSIVNLTLCVADSGK